MNFKSALHTVTLAVALACGGAAHAADAYDRDIASASGLVVDPNGKVMNQEPGFSYPAVSVTFYDMSNVSNPGQSFLAYCFQPDVVLGPDASYTASYAVGTGVVSTSVRKLFESAYKSTLGDEDKQVSFQLALWELQGDDGNLYATTGHQYFSETGKYADARVADAALMLENAAKLTALQGTYSYTVFKGVNPDDTASQTLIGVAEVSAVPEVETWAMLGAGLGMLGLVRRRSAKLDKFSA